MGLDLFVSTKVEKERYHKNYDSEYKSISLFVNKSKNGKQYLDFMSASGDDSSAGGTYQGSYYLLKDKEVKDETVDGNPNAGIN